MNTLTDNLSRAAAIRAATDGDGRTLFGHFSVFNTWYEVNSLWEGNFLERIAPGAFKRTMEERRDQIKVLYDHGNDPMLGNKPLGALRELKEDETGGFYEVGLSDTSYNRDMIIPLLRDGLLGASFRFRVRAEEWVDEPDPSEANPRGLPERTIKDTDLYELGPVTFPANPAADAALRSTTDEFLERMLSDPLFVARFAERTSPRAAENLLASLPSHGRSKDALKGSTHGQREGIGAATRLRLAEAKALSLG